MKTSVFLNVTMEFDTTVQLWPIAPRLAQPGSSKSAYDRAFEQAQLAEDSGFDWISVTEHHYSPRMLSPSPNVLAAALAAKTSRVKIALLGPLLPLSNPIRLAEEVAMLDNISDGRVICLFLRGTPNEVLTYTTNQDETREITQEGIELILKAWTEPEPFAWEGRYFSFRNIAPWPKLIQQPFPKMYGSGNSQESIAFVAKKRMALATSFIPPPVLKTAADLYRHIAAQEGWTPGADDILYRCYAYVSNTLAEAEAVLQKNPDVFANLYRLHKDIQTAVNGAVPRGFPSRPGLFGSPDAVVEQLGQLHEIGVGVVDVSFNWPGLTHAQRMKAMETYAAKVLPQIRNL